MRVKADVRRVLRGDSRPARKVTENVESTKNQGQQNKLIRITIAHQKHERREGVENSHAALSSPALYG
jgi:hypothetical protein